MQSDAIRHDWTLPEVEALFELPFNDLLYRAQTVHRQHFDPNTIQASTLLSIKTGACPEDCAYCPQSVRHDTGLSREALLEVEQVVAAARKAREAGATRFCMGAAWRSPKDRDVAKVAEMVRQVKALGLETCATLGMLDADQAQTLKEAGLDYYNHNLDTSEEFYGRIITTRTYLDRLNTLENVRAAGRATLTRHGGEPEPVRLVEVGPEEALPVLRAWPSITPDGVSMMVDAGVVTGPTPDELAEAVGICPVFRVEGDV